MTSQVMIEQLYVANDTARVEKLPPDLHPCMRAIRLYCVQSGSRWMLQIRAPVSLAHGRKDGAHSYYAHVRLSLEEMKELRDRLGDYIADAEGMCGT